MKKAIRNDVVEDFDDRAANDAGCPLTLNHAFVDFGDLPVAERIVISCIDDRRQGREIGKKIGW